MSLQAQPPLRMGQAVLHGETGVLLALRSVHRLEQQAREAEFLEQFRGRTLLREDKLEFVAAGQFQRCARLRADADPVQSRGSVLSAVGLDSYLEPRRVQGLDGGLVELQKWLAAGADDERARPRMVCAVPRGSLPPKPTPERWQNVRRLDRSCPRSRCHRTGRSRERDPSPGRSTGCNW